MKCGNNNKNQRHKKMCELVRKKKLQQYNNNKSYEEIEKKPNLRRPLS